MSKNEDVFTPSIFRVNQNYAILNCVKSSERSWFTARCRNFVQPLAGNSREAAFCAGFGESESRSTVFESRCALDRGVEITAKATRDAELVVACAEDGDRIRDEFCVVVRHGVHLGGRGRPPLHRRRGIYEEGVELSLTAAAHSTYNPRGENHLWSLSMILGGRC